ncbi:hypothetical protein NA57DRAFT_79702 [Rhizodiscina lignyota]|uniref:Uncharacterized protein n=1 Tax=Rhizodiscina lignyota TaxID=1504668 RepID=A0A9P4M6V6_9PEZI|nr:hypothetical protein NA57DRAFT_79702 [Rhizodiscina lignyota]
MAGGAAKPGAHPVTPAHIAHGAKFYHRFFAVGLGASMWFFLMYRAKKDGAAFLGLKHPWDH